MAILNLLINCSHNNKSLASDTGLVVCFNCGSTHRTGEDGWFAPWIWRDKPKTKPKKKAAPK